MTIKDYLISLGLAAGGALLIIFFVWLFSLISWALVWAGVTFALIPVGSAAIKFWQDNDCVDIDDFFNELLEATHEVKKKISSIDDDEDW